jgi:steroid 5-alpha reductase family enzyme
MLLQPEAVVRASSIRGGRGAWWTALSPILMTFLLVRVSGVSMLESALRETRSGYGEYMQSTSAFFPLLPRRRT